MNSEKKIPKEAREFFADVTAQRIAGVYAESLFAVAVQHNEVDDVLNQLTELTQEIFARHPELEEFFTSRAVSREHKVAVLEHTFQGRASDIFLNFLLVLNHHDRLDLIRPVLHTFRELYDQRSGKVRVQVTTAAPLPEDQQERLKHELRSEIQREPILELQVDPQLLSGIVIRIRDWLYDGSLRTRLDRLRKEIIERSSYEIQSRRDRFCSDE